MNKTVTAKTVKAAANDLYTYRVTWSPEDGEYVGLCAEFPSLSWLADSPEVALAGVRNVVAESVVDLMSEGEAPPEALAERRYSGEFRVPVPAEVHRSLALAIFRLTHEQEK